jgi:hypothetical protein
MAQNGWQAAYGREGARTVSSATFAKTLIVGGQVDDPKPLYGERATKIGEELEPDTNAMCRLKILSSGQVLASGSVEEGLS